MAVFMGKTIQNVGNSTMENGVKLDKILNFGVFFVFL
jgi:hypothetical protein